MELREARGPELDAAGPHALLMLRVAVFVVEQRCAYAELDGHDLEAEVRHCWFEQGGRVVAYLRVGPEAGSDGHWIRRVCTDRDYRGQGLGARLLDHALASTPGRIRIAAQTHLAGWYQGFGFRSLGEPFDEDGVNHVHMVLDR